MHFQQKRFLFLLFRFIFDKLNGLINFLLLYNGKLQWGRKKINLGKMANKHVSNKHVSTAQGNISVGRVKHSYKALLYKQCKFLGSNKRNLILTIFDSSSSCCCFFCAWQSSSQHLCDFFGGNLLNVTSGHQDSCPAPILKVEN